VAGLGANGFAVIGGIITPRRVETYRDAVFRVRDKTIAAVGREAFEHAVAAGNNELRLPLLFEPVLFDVLADERVLALVDAVLGPAAIVRFFNTSITPPEQSGATSRLTGHFHQNFKVPLNAPNGPPVFLEITAPLTTPVQRFRILPASHKFPEPPGKEDLETHALHLDWEPGDAMVMTPFVWHREDENLADSEAASIFVQFSRPFIKPHADYMRAIDAATLAQLPERTRRLLGEHSQLPASIADFYLPPDQRPYRPGQW
jgi:ectoine hydroxylase-related dioxygenase (phytanoyl-CoA dioxygenase family)